MTTTSKGRLLLAACAGAALAAAPAGAAATPKPARIAATTLSAPPSPLATGTTFVARGTVRNTGGRSSAAELSFKLRTLDAPYVSVALGGARVGALKAHASRRFAKRLTVDASRLGGNGGRGYVLVVCVKRSRTDTTTLCRKAPEPVRVRPDAEPATPATPAGPGSPASPADPAEPAAPVGPDRADYRPGARSLGDTLFPTIGNGGYDALSYDLDLAYDIDTMLLRGSSTATQVATQDLSSFSFDLADYVTPSAVTVDGLRAAFEQVAGDKLVVTPAKGLRAGTTFTTRVTYAATERAYVDPDGSREGWVPDPVRGAVVVSEPVGAMGWFPNDDVPFDKATYRIRMSVPEPAAPAAPWRVVATGVLADERVADGRRITTWEDTDPTASYLVGVAIGRYDVATSTTTPTAANPLAVPFTTAVDSSFTTGKGEMLTRLARTPAINDFYAAYYGLAYPFTSQGGIVPRQAVGYSLETQSKPTYATSTNRDYRGPSVDTVAHENGHGWFGDYLTLTQWKDIWINEGMTEFSSELWSEREDGGPTLDDTFAGEYADPQLSWAIAPADPPTAADIFDYDAMYVRGSMTMIQVLRILGEEPFRALMHDYLVQPGHAYGTTTTEQFVALVKARDAAARKAAGLPDRTERWTEFFRQWLLTAYPDGEKPDLLASNFDD